ncbi:hypothetical protein EG68_00465 [Paragonimus skrjabini miyazakii]|uniref:Uncharacterized protein n=1 Tax=Paragonimus skrjabini miyazakii TaxID=59628 RepID=A0A8S9Z428_9TREM|nr:hypothetical protein EG68_00465 [Paragonimus skrjabini miyazakii]
MNGPCFCRKSKEVEMRTNRQFGTLKEQCWKSTWSHETSDVVQPLVKQKLPRFSKSTDEVCSKLYPTIGDKRRCLLILLVCQI